MTAAFVPIEGCSYCAQGFATACPYHGPSATAQGGTGGIAITELVLHRHRWIYDGVALSGGYLYHCDEHDPPVIRLVLP